MLQLFSDLASWLTFGVMGLDPNTKLADSIHFFIEDTT